MSTVRCLPIPTDTPPLILESDLTRPPSAASFHGLALHVVAAGGGSATQMALAARTRRLMKWLGGGVAIAIGNGRPRKYGGVK